MIYVLSQGCAANFGDGEKIARILSKQDNVSFEFPLEDASEQQNAESKTFYLNVCTVKGNAGAIKLLKKVHDAYPSATIFITGCTPKDFQEAALQAVPSVNFTTLKELEANNPNDESCEPLCKADSKTLRESPFVGIVNIEEGCLDACAFCSTHLVKGRLRSFDADSIVAQVQRLANDGCLEIQLTGQDCACYGFDINTNLAELVQKILVRVPGDYKIRLGMGNPRHMLSYLEPLLDCFTDKRIYKFIHLPVQSGSDNVLKAMGRKHSVEDYRKLAKAFTESFDRFTLSTDIIVGFPGETEADYIETEKLVQETRPTVCNITRFVARPGTPAARMEQDSSPFAAVPDSIKHERSARLAEVFQHIACENNREWIGEECYVFTEKSGYREGTTIARNEAYRPVALQGLFPAGQKIKVKITGAEPFALIAEPL